MFRLLYQNHHQAKLSQIYIKENPYIMLFKVFCLQYLAACFGFYTKAIIRLNHYKFILRKILILHYFSSFVNSISLHQYTTVYLYIYYFLYSFEVAVLCFFSYVVNELNLSKVYKIYKIF
jgi:hypothetical protein